MSLPHLTCLTKMKDFKFVATSDIGGKLSDLRGKYVVLFFYPKDNTPGCTRESSDFKALYNSFQNCNAVVYGVSLDTLKSHESFKEKLDLPFDLISDKDGALCNLFKTHKSNLLLEKIAGIDRSTFLIDPEGHLIQEWRKVRVNGHANEVLEALKSHLDAQT